MTKRSGVGFRWAWLYSSATGDVPEDVRVVHSSHGRLRAHLVNWSGNGAREIEARFEDVPGVRSVSASSISQNVLILFAPRLTNSAALLEALRGAWSTLPSPVETEVRVRPARASRAAPPTPVLTEDIVVCEPTRAPTRPIKQPVYVTGSLRRLYKGFGWASVGMAVIGAIMPGIPTAPFVILASYFFIRSSPESREWLLNSRWFGPTLRDWEEKGGVRRPIKYVALALMAGGMYLTFQVGLPLPVLTTVVAFQVLGIAIILLLPVAHRTVPVAVLGAP
jgi:uncharacterized protein